MKGRTSRFQGEIFVSGRRRRAGKRAFSTAVCFASGYAGAASNLGFHYLLRVLEENTDLGWERAFYEAPGAAGKVSRRRPGRSFESGRLLESFDTIVFTLPFESDYPHVLEMLREGGVEPLREKRNTASPLVVGGGIAVSSNPEPLRDFFDAFYVGEGSAAAVRFLELAAAARRKLNPEAYSQLCRMDNVLCPGSRRRAVSAPAPGLGGAPPASFFVSAQAHFRNTFLIEIGKGCPFACRFCLARHVHAPLRWAQTESVLEALGVDLSMVKTVGLIAPSPSEHPELDRIIEAIAALGKRITLSSVRADKLRRETLRSLIASGSRSLTLAPEVGSERMKRVIRKRMDDAETEETVVAAAREGVRSLTLYFLMGLPWETDDDVARSADLARRLAKAFLRAAGRGRVHVELNPFVPKPRTPFQWCRMEEGGVLQRRGRLFQEQFGCLRGARVSLGSSRKALVQALLSRGDRTLGKALLRWIERGTPFLKAAELESPRSVELVFAEQDPGKKLPWDYLMTPGEREYLESQYLAARRSALGC